MLIFKKLIKNKQLNICASKVQKNSIQINPLTPPSRRDERLCGWCVPVICFVCFKSM